MKKTLSLVLIGSVAGALQLAASTETTPRAASAPIVAPSPLAAPGPAPIGTLSRMAVTLRAEPLAEDVGQIMTVTAPAGDGRLFLIERQGGFC